MSDYKCVKCGVSNDGVAGLWLKDPTKADRWHSDFWCGDCAVARWACNVPIVWGLGIPDDVRKATMNFEMLKRLQGWQIPHKYVIIHVFHRREAETIGWMKDWSGRRSERPDEPYSCRGWCGSNEIVVLYDETETPESIKWIILHELGHAVCNRTYMFDQAMSEENKIEGRTTYEWKDDVGHEADSEERLVNRIATAWCGGQERARPWWRPRVVARERGYTVFPDAFAETRSPEFYMFCVARAEGWASKLPIQGFDTTTAYEPVQVQGLPAPSEDERKQPDFREKLLRRLQPDHEKVGMPVPSMMCGSPIAEDAGAVSV